MTIRQFARAVTSSKVRIMQFPNDVWALDFNASVALESVLNQLPEKYKCSTVGYFGGVLSVGICPKYLVC